MKKHVALLKGGWSAEREVSLSTGSGVEKALNQLGYQVSVIDVQPDIAVRLTELKPDVVFNALHGQWGEDGCIQGLLELLKIPYTHSGVLASALAMDKPAAKRIFAAAGLRCAQGEVMRFAALLAECPFPLPVVAKLPNNGSSVGVYIIHTQQELELLQQKIKPEQELLVEIYIPGREIQVAVLDTSHGEAEALGAIEIKPIGEFYDYEAKYTAGRAEHLMPAPLGAAEYEQVCQLAVRAHRALGCRGVTRSDFRYDDTKLGEGLFYLLETNTQPGMTPLSLVPEIAAHREITYNEVVKRLIESARLDNN
ncbi:MAG: D-alanine--D-alanine ligase [Rickettsiales bacterium]|nr:D-alanine--D-alanine ligase [Rickettsiales bacterium]